MNNPEQPTAKPEEHKKTTKPDEEIDNPAEAGRKAIDAHKALAPGSPEDKDQQDRDDAEKWRNEG